MLARTIFTWRQIIEQNTQKIIPKDAMRWGEREKRDLLIYDMMHESNFLALNSRSSGAFSSKEFRVIRWGSSRHDHVSQIIPP